MLMSHLTVRPSVPSEFDTVLPMCVAAFADEAVSAWVEPEPERRQERTRDLFASSLRAAVGSGQLVVALLPDGDPVAASVWVDLDGAPRLADLPDLPDDDGTVSRRLAAVLSATGARHPAVPHVYLSAMAALPRHRGLGAGTAILRYGLGRARELGLPVYLEASTPRNRRLYARHGFQDHSEPIYLPEGGPALQPMWHGAEWPTADGAPS
ncbi:Acetyltransferase (GNAT) family protein [Promicromonospora umidemergens]|uniref:N-acetyltransferase domain-containing protein n=1 Tax=Promicromonospora umidemergens TaxID=629679 RepID=A0ABP8XLT1_9MICO|nr:GNAT family N-acetyltransferase [Promicromonospora umidemergens]MCP2282176.1 Acetyltransferase (GNAT) family protein [Promicromonospora umidemergens]